MKLSSKEPSSKKLSCPTDRCTKIGSKTKSAEGRTERAAHDDKKDQP
jgi:hypothetical protein